MAFVRHGCAGVHSPSKSENRIVAALPVGLREDVANSRSGSNTNALYHSGWKKYLLSLRTLIREGLFLMLQMLQFL